MTHQEWYMRCYTWLLFAKLSMSFNSRPAGRLHPCTNTIHTHRHDPLHCLQLQGVLVAIQHLLQVIVSTRERERGKTHTKKLALNFPVCSPCWAAPPDYRGLKREKQTCFFTLKIHQSMQAWPRNYSLWSEKSNWQNMGGFESGARENKIIGTWHNPKKRVDVSQTLNIIYSRRADPVQPKLSLYAWYHHSSLLCHYLGGKKL